MKLKFLILLLLLDSGCSSLIRNLYKDPVVKINSLTLTNLTLDEINFNLGVGLENPNSIPLSLNQIDYLLKLSGKQIIQGQFTDKINIAPSEMKTIFIPLKIKFSSMKDLLNWTNEESTNTKYEFTGTVQMGIIKIPFSKIGVLKLNY